MAASLDVMRRVEYSVVRVSDSTLDVDRCRLVCSCMLTLIADEYME